MTDVSCLVDTFRTIVEQRLENDLVTALQRRNISWLLEFLCIHQNVASTQKVYTTSKPRDMVISWLGVGDATHHSEPQSAQCKVGLSEENPA